jgi:hypothetical protein
MPFLCLPLAVNQSFVKFSIKQVGHYLQEYTASHVEDDSTRSVGRENF